MSGYQTVHLLQMLVTASMPPSDALLLPRPHPCLAWGLGARPETAYGLYAQAAALAGRTCGHGRVIGACSMSWVMLTCMFWSD